MAKFKTYLVIHPDEKSGQTQHLQLEPIETDRKLIRGDIVDTQKFTGAILWRFWRVVEIIHRSDKVVALVRYEPKQNLIKNDDDLA